MARFRPHLDYAVKLWCPISEDINASNQYRKGWSKLRMPDLETYTTEKNTLKKLNSYRGEDLIIQKYQI